MDGDVLTDDQVEDLLRIVGPDVFFAIIYARQGLEVQLASNMSDSCLIQTLHVVLDGVEGESEITVRKLR